MSVLPPVPPQVIAPFKERLAHLRSELAKLESDPSGPDFGHASEKGRLVTAIGETEALIKRLETQNVPRPA